MPCRRRTYSGDRSYGLQQTPARRIIQRAVGIHFISPIRILRTCQTRASNQKTKPREPAAMSNPATARRCPPPPLPLMSNARAAMSNPATARLQRLPLPLMSNARAVPNFVHAKCASREYFHLLQSFSLPSKASSLIAEQIPHNCSARHLFGESQPAR